MMAKREMSRLNKKQEIEFRNGQLIDRIYKIFTRPRQVASEKPTNPNPVSATRTSASPDPTNRPSKISYGLNSVKKR